MIMERFRFFTLREETVPRASAFHRFGRYLLVALSLMLMGCGEESVEEKPVARPVNMLTIGSLAGSGVLEYPGKVAAAQQSNMAFEASGRIIEFRFKEGQMVKKGDLLARLDPRDFQAELERERAKRNAVKSEYERVRALYEVDAASRRDLDVARRNFEVAVANLKTAQKKLEDSYLKAPFAGVMAKKVVEDFANVRAKQPVLILQDNSSLVMKVNVPERDVAGGKPGLTPEKATARLKPMVEVSSLPGRRFPARIKEYAATADPVTRTFEVTFAFENPADARVMPGMTGKAVISRPNPKPGNAIPAKAVLSDESGRSFVWLVDPQSLVVTKKPVVLGELSGSDVQVRSGLSDGDLIVTSGVHQLREGMQVRRLVN